MYNQLKLTTYLLFCVFFLPVSGFSEELTREQIKGLDEQIQDIKKDVLAISAELSLLEEKLLYPSNTQVSLFVSIVKESDYSPDAVEIKIDNKNIAHHIYSYKEVAALQRGGVQRIYTGNIRGGDHKLNVSVLGAGQKQAEKASFVIKKSIGAKLVEISLGSGDSIIKIKER